MKNILSPLLIAACSVMMSTSTTLSAADLPPDNAYVVVDDAGHLSVDGKRQRFWSVIGKPLIKADVKADDSAEDKAAKLEKSRTGTDYLLDRFANLGFNSIRLWDVCGGMESYIVGDGSHADCVDYLVSEAGKRGMRIWAAGLGNRVGNASPEDVTIINDPATADGWIEAINQYNGLNEIDKKKARPIDIRHSMARHWDPRLEALYIQRMQENGNHLNKHNGLRWADDPTFAVWELTNEEWWFRKMIGGNWQKEPAFFRNSLIAGWQDFLIRKYGDDTKLKAAWGNLLPGEDLDDKSVLLAPMNGKTKTAISMNDANEIARASLEGLQQEYSIEDFSSARASDVIEYFLDIQLGHKQRSAAGIKNLGKSTKLSLTIYDTGIGYEIQSQFIHQHGDASVHDAYVNGWGPVYKEPDTSGIKQENLKMLAQLDAERISQNTGPWINWLLKPPGISQAVPWLEHNKVVGQPYLCYETQIQQPAKYRADYPLRLAALASIQDWDWISWHYFASGDDVGTAERPFDRAMDVTSGRHPQGYHYTYDEVQNAMMREASFIWRQELLAPAPNPTTFIYGRKSLTDPASMPYGGSYGTSGMDMLQTTYQYGVRIQIDPSREDDQVIGPVVTYADRLTHNPYTPTDAITFDWKKGYLMFDAPKAIAFTGLLAKYGDSVTFANGVTLSQVTIANDAGIFSPVTEDEKYIAFALTVEDGQSLAISKKASISLQSTSFNTGFTIDADKVRANGIDQGTVNGGTFPVLKARVGATVSSPDLNGMTYQFLDWHFNVLGTGTITDGKLAIPTDQSIFIVKLTR